MMRLLVQAGAKQSAAFRAFCHALWAGRNTHPSRGPHDTLLECIKSLTQGGSSVAYKALDGSIALHQLVAATITACAKDWTDTVAYLQDAGLDVNAPNARGRTALHLAKGDAIQALLAAGADMNAIDKDRNTPLLRAADTGDMKKVRQLLGAGADPTDRTSSKSSYSVHPGAIYQRYPRPAEGRQKQGPLPAIPWGSP